MASQDVPAIDYTARDFLTIKAALQQHLQTRFPDTWRDFYESNAGMALLELICYAFDVLSFSIDFSANEVFLPTARDRLSVLLLGRLVGYQLRTPTSASVVCKTTLAFAYAEAVIIPAGTTITTPAGISFLTTQDTRIAAGLTTSTILFVQGTARANTFTSDGSIFQRFTLSESPVVEETVTLLVDGNPWTEVESLVYSDANGDNYSVEYDESSVAKILFGDGTSGRVPPIGSVISVSYRTGGGIQGNIALNQISGTVQGYRELVTPISYVNVVVANDTQRGSGGEDAETLTHAKLWIPRWVKANGRAVTEDDFDVLANTFSDPVYGAPAYAKAKLKQEIPELNTVLLYLWSRDSGGNIVAPSSGLKAAVEAYFNNNGVGAVRTICTHTEVEDGDIFYVDINLTVKTVSSYVQATVLTAIQSAVDALFTSSDNIPGASFRISALYKAIQSVAGVDYCLINSCKGSYAATDLIGIGDGTTTLFSNVIALDSGLPIVPYTVRMYYGADIEVLTDDGNGTLVNGLGQARGTVDYDTGDISGTFDTAPGIDVSIYADYRHVLDYQRGEAEGTGDGTTRRFRGALDYPPLNPFDPTTGLKGVAFSDGTQVVTDDGSGNLIGDVDPAGRNTIDDETGAYDFTFAAPPPLGAVINSTYKERLDVDSQDLPVQKNELAIKGRVGITVVT